MADSESASSPGTRRPSVIVCLTGSELTRGETRDANGSWLAAELTVLGFRVVEMRILPDDRAAIVRGLREIWTRADVILTSGGLGPTSDDLTVPAVAEVAGRDVVRDPATVEALRAFAADRWGPDRPVPDNFFLQARIVEGGAVLANPRGLACGCAVEIGGGRVLLTLPGVPAELRAMFREGAAPLLQRRFAPPPLRIARLKILDVPESLAEARIQRLPVDWSRLEYGISARPGELTIKLLADGPEDGPLVDDAIRRLQAEFGDALTLLPEGLTSGGDSASFARLILDRLRGAGTTLATAESCTGGLIGKLLTDVPGSSDVYRGGVIAYHNDAKEAMLGVPRALLDAHGAVSEPVARAMAAGARERLGAGYAIATTGVAGPGGGTPDKPVGLVWLAVDGPRGSSVRELRLRGDRGLIRERTATAALDLLRRAIGTESAAPVVP